MGLSLDAQDIEMLKRLLVIRACKEDRLRQQLLTSQNASKALDIKSSKLNVERQALMVQLTQQVLPQEVLNPNELLRFKLKLAKGYQQERAFSEALEELKLEANELILGRKALNADILRLSKDQEKLKAVLDE